MLLRRNVDEHVLAAPLFGDDAVLRKFLTYALGVRAILIDLVHRNNNRHVCRFRVVDCLDGLRHNAVIGRNNQDDNVGDLRTAGTHCRKRLVTRGIDERNLMIHQIDHRSADMLRNAARFACRNARMTNGIKQRRLAVVNVTHNGNNGRTWLQIFIGIVVDHCVFFFGRYHAALLIQVIGNKLNQVITHRLREREHLTQHEQALDDFVRLHANELGKLGNACTLGDLNNRFIQNKRRIQAALDCLLFSFLTCFLRALLLALLAAAFAFRGSSGNSGTRLGKHLIALQLFSLNGHLRVTIGAILLRSLHQLVYLGLSYALATLLLGRRLIRCTRRIAIGLCALRRSGFRLFFFHLRIVLHALLLSLDLIKKRAELIRRLRGSNRRNTLRLLMLRSPLCRCFRGRMALLAAAQALFYAAFLRNFCCSSFGTRTRFCLGLFALNTHTLGFNLVCQTLERRNLGSLLAGRMFCPLDSSFLVFQGAIATSTLFFAQLALRLYGSTALSLFGLLFRFFFRLLFRQLGCFGIVKFAGALLDLGRKLLADLLHAFFLQRSRMGFGRDIHLCQQIKHLFA